MLTYSMEKRENTGKTEFLARSIREDILAGRLADGERLPSKRALAAHLGVSVGTVENAYLMLADEGFISPKAGSGFYVNRIPHRRREKTDSLGPGLLPEEMAAGRREEPLTASFPQFARIMRKLLSEKPEILMEDPPRLGCAVLRNAIAKYLYRYRGMRVDADRIIVGSGAEYLYGLLVQLFGREELFGIEDPSYEKIRRVYEANGASVELLPMGTDGIRDEALASARARILHVTPFNSYPSGVTATAEKRLSYIRWANEKDAILIEDDFDSEFNTPRKPLETLYAMDGGRHVVYINTFSKSIAPSMRAGYMILPDHLMAVYREKLGFYACTVPVFDQYMLAEFIESGAFERHLMRMRRMRR